MAKQKSTTTGYAKAGGKRRTNISINGELADLAQEHFPATPFGSLSGFVEKKIRQEFRKLAPKLRKAGFKMPEQLFAK